MFDSRRSGTTLTLALALGTLLCTGAAEPASGQASQDHPLSQAIDAVFADIDPDGPGCAVGVISAGELEYANGFGMANLDYGIPITPRSNFYMGSVGKQFTAAVIAHAASEGHLSLDDDIRKWLPEMPEYERTITVRHLIHHISGVRDYLGLLGMAGRRSADVITDEEILELITWQKNTNFPTGDQYLYSNSGYFLLSVIVERATDMTLREYAQAHFFGPLGMDRSTFYDDRLQVLPERVVGYEATDDGYQLDHLWNFDKVGSGGVYSNIEDMARWDRNFYTEEVGGPGFTEQLLERGELTDGEVIPYAFGLAHGEYRGLQTVAHGGSLAGFRANVLRFPEQRTTVVILCSFGTSDPGDRSRGVADIVLADYLDPTDEVDTGEAPADAETEPSVDRTPVQLSEEQLDAFVGHWNAREIGIIVEIVREDDQLFFIQSGQRAPLTTLANNMLFLAVAEVTMTLSDMVDGRFASMDVEQRGQQFSAVREDPETVEFDPAEFIGAYYSEELDVTYRVFEEDGALMMEVPPDQQGRLSSSGDDVFRRGNVEIVFDRQPDGIEGFTVNAGRVLGLYFQRVE